MFTSAAAIFGGKILDLLIGIVTVCGVWWRLKSNSNEITRELIKKLEKNSQEIERLKTEIKAWKHHHRQLIKTTNADKKRHLQL